MMNVYNLINSLKGDKFKKRLSDIINEPGFRAKCDRRRGRRKEQPASPYKAKHSADVGSTAVPVLSALHGQCGTVRRVNIEMEKGEGFI